MSKEATLKRGANPDVPKKPDAQKHNTDEKKLEQGLEESMAGSDVASVTQPGPKE